MYACGVEPMQTRLTISGRGKKTRTLGPLGNHHAYNTREQLLLLHKRLHSRPYADAPNFH